MKDENSPLDYYLVAKMSRTKYMLTRDWGKGAFGEHSLEERRTYGKHSSLDLSYFGY